MKPEDLLLAPELSPEQAHQFLKRYGFKDPETADRNLQLVAEEVDIRLILARMIGGLLEAARQTPDPDSALNYFERFFSALTHPANFLGFLSETPEALEALTLICGTSPFSAEILVRNPEYFYWLLDQLGTPWTKSSETYALEAGQATSKFEDKESKLHALARFKRREMLRIGARDFLKVADVVGTITELSNLADVVIQSVYEICYQWLTYKLGVPRYIDESGNLKEARFTIMAMGKLGGHELNYSSDIDLIYVYDGEQENTELRPLGAAIEWGAHQSGAVPPGIRSTAITDFFTKLAQSITHELSALTEEGYFYRVDLRLRPEGSAGPVACSLAACRNYYATWGETFERMALIKARPVGGSIELGLEFCSALGNFIYRKFLDFAALEEIQEIKTRIDSKLGSKEKQARHVKLGAGGIREIEFFVQALQLIYGGSNSGLQERNTVQSLEKLRSHRYLSQKEYQELLNAYLFLRDLEHKLQMVYHLQTHELPTEEEELYKCARRMGFRGKSPSETIDRFMRTYETHTSAVRKIFQDLISYKREGTPGMQMKEASLILNKSLSEVESLEILSKPGFEDLKTALHQIVLLRDAPSFAHSPSKMRNLLANLLPLLLETLRQSPDPDTGLSYFERFVSALGTRDSLYMLLNESSTALHRLILVLSSSQFLADFLCRKPEYLDSLLRDDFLLEVKEIELYQFQLQQILKESKDLETRISLLRSFQQEEMFRIQVTDLLNFCERPSVGKQLASLAEACLTAAFEIACFELEKKLGNSFGQWARNHFVILALGKLGGNDLSYNSDLDLVYFHSADLSEETKQTQMHLVQLVELIDEVLNISRGLGSIYKIDIRLRPEGKKGGLVAALDRYEEYLSHRAEAWERLALVRHRFILGIDANRDRLSGLLCNFIYQHELAPGAIKEISHVRHRMEVELAKEAAEDRFHIKAGAGGLVDIEFAVQLLQLKHGSEYSSLRIPNTLAALAKLKELRKITKSDFQVFSRGYEFLRMLENRLRIASPFGTATISRQPKSLGKIARLLRHTSTYNVPMGQDFESTYLEISHAVRSAYQRILEKLTKLE